MTSCQSGQQQHAANPSAQPTNKRRWEAACAQAPVASGGFVAASTTTSSGAGFKPAVPLRNLASTEQFGACGRNPSTSASGMELSEQSFHHPSQHHHHPHSTSHPQSQQQQQQQHKQQPYYASQQSHLQHRLSGTASSSLQSDAAPKGTHNTSASLLHLSRSRSGASHLASSSSASDRDAATTVSAGGFQRPHPPPSAAAHCTDTPMQRLPTTGDEGGSPRPPHSEVTRQQQQPAVPSAFRNAVAAAPAAASCDSAGLLSVGQLERSERCLAHLPLELQSRLRKKVRLIQPISPTWEAEVMQPNSQPSSPTGPQAHGAAAAVVTSSVPPAASGGSLSPRKSDENFGKASVHSALLAAVEAHLTGAELVSATSLPQFVVPSPPPSAVSSPAGAPAGASALLPSPLRGFRPVASSLQRSSSSGGAAAAAVATAAPAPAGAAAPPAGRINGDLLVRQLATARQAAAGMAPPTDSCLPLLLPAFDNFAAPPPPVSYLRAASANQQPLPQPPLFSAPAGVPALGPSPLHLSRMVSQPGLPAALGGAAWLAAQPPPAAVAAAAAAPLHGFLQVPGIAVAAAPAVSPVTGFKRARGGNAAAAAAAPAPLAACVLPCVTPALPPPVAAEDVHGQLSVLYQWYQSNKTAYLEQAKQSLVRLEAQRASTGGSGVSQDAAVVRAFERAVQIISASSDVEMQTAAAVARSKAPSSPHPRAGGVISNGGSAAAAAAVAQAIIDAAQNVTFRKLPMGLFDKLSAPVAVGPNGGKGIK